MTSPFRYRGTPIDELSREDLIKVCEYLLSQRMTTPVAKESQQSHDCVPDFIKSALGEYL